MKKLTKILFTVLAFVMLAVSFAGCNFVLSSDPNSSDNTPPSNDVNNFTQPVTEPIEYIAGESGTLIDNGDYKVTFGTYSAQDRKSYNGDYKLAYADLNRACVAIRMEQESSSVYTFGSGTIIDVEGASANHEYYIITANHVIEDLGKVTVFVPDENGRNYTDVDYNEDYAFTGELGNIESTDKITLVGGDKQSDVGVIKLTLTAEEDEIYDIAQVKVAPTSYKTQVGESVFAIGNPTGKLPGTLSAGYISYLNRGTSVDGIGEMQLIQMNLDIYHGSSGGALFNEYGELIGVTNAGDDDNKGINFAVPHQISDDLNVLDDGFIDVAKQLIATKNKYPQNYGFVSGHKQKYGITTQSNAQGDVVVIDVAVGSIAQRAGLKANDIILEINGQAVNGSADCKNMITAVEVGGELKILVRRGASTGCVTMHAHQYRLGDTGLDLPVVAE